jgi:hypothetical protein
MTKAKDVFDLAKLVYPGSPADQARLLLREVKPFGVVNPSPAVLPATLEKLLTAPGHAADWPSVMGSVQNWGATKHLDFVHQLGGGLDKPLSATKDGHSALYFVIHDTSAPTLAAGTQFPPNINDAAWSGNRLQRYSGTPDPVAHMFVNRAGDSATGHDFGEPKYATKFERDHRKILTGRFIHTELIQPRTENAHHIDEIAPLPGFSEAQITRLALLYICASARARQWLIPAFHCVIDEGIPDGHDDPQHFSLAGWDASLSALFSEFGVQP